MASSKVEHDGSVRRPTRDRFGGVRRAAGVVDTSDATDHPRRTTSTANAACMAPEPRQRGGRPQAQVTAVNTRNNARARAAAPVTSTDAIRGRGRRVERANTRCPQPRPTDVPL